MWFVIEECIDSLELGHVHHGDICDMAHMMRLTYDIGIVKASVFYGSDDAVEYALTNYPERQVTAFY